jgi:hypothetical protein
MALVTWPGDEGVPSMSDARRWLVRMGTAAALLGATGWSAQGDRRLDLPKLPNAEPRNVVLILTDDHRYDALSFLRAQPFIETLHLDALAAGGVHVRNAFVTTSLCCPSRASILTGLYAHRHRVIDNNDPVPGDLTFFPQYLQRAGYQTAFVGKWHMGGDHDDPQRGFDHWVSFRGQGSYLPERNGLNVDGRRVPQKGHLTDELTDYALDWLRSRKRDRPFFLYLSHKGVHSDFVPPDRYRGRAEGKPFHPPRTMRPENVEGVSSRRRVAAPAEVEDGKILVREPGEEERLEVRGVQVLLGDRVAVEDDRLAVAQRDGGGRRGRSGSNRGRCEEQDRDRRDTHLPPLVAADSTRSGL